MLGRPPRRSSRLLLTTLSLAALACSAPTDTRPTPEMARLALSANVSSTSIASLVVKVSASDINPTLVFNLAVTNGTIGEGITIPAGSNRKLQVEGYDAAGVKTHAGETTIAAVKAGDNPPVAVTLAPIPGQQAVTLTFGNYSVVVTPGSGTITVPGGATPTVTLVATVNDANGNPVTGAAVKWATANPAIASVSAAGVVAGVSAGTVKVVATYQGVGGEASITVTP